MIGKRRLYWSIVLFIAGMFAFVLGGCCPMKPAKTAAPAEAAVEAPAVMVAEEVPPVPLQEVEEIAVAEVIIAVPEMEYHLVKRGECLWWIAEYEDVYNDPFMWPVIYDANKDQISNPDLIYPGQELKIPRLGYTMEDVQKVRQSAGAPRPYTPPEGAQPPVQ